MYLYSFLVSLSCKSSYTCELSISVYVLTFSSIRPGFTVTIKVGLLPLVCSSLRSIHYRSFLATMESADFLSFVVTRFPSTRPHGISRTSFLVYSRNLRTWATSIFLDFSALGHLIHPIRLIIAFLFVEPRFRYPFLSPLPHDSQAWESLTGSPIASALWDFHPRCTTCPSYPKKPPIFFEGFLLYLKIYYKL